MMDGWYRITGPSGDKDVIEVFGNTSRLGSIHRLQQNYLFEEVEIFTKEELKKRIDDEVTERMAREYD